MAHKKHEEWIHPGITKIISTVRRIKNIKNLKKIVLEIILNCSICNTKKNLNGQPEETKRLYRATKINQKISIDIKGPIQTIFFNMTLQKRISTL